MPMNAPASELNAATTQEQLATAALPPPETVRVHHTEVYCDGAGYGDGGEHHPLADIPSALGHPRVYLTIPPSHAFVDCTYCDRRFVVRG